MPARHVRSIAVLILRALSWLLTGGRFCPLFPRIYGRDVAQKHPMQLLRNESCVTLSSPRGQG